MNKFINLVLIVPDNLSVMELSTAIDTAIMAYNDCRPEIESRLGNGEAHIFAKGKVVECVNCIQPEVNVPKILEELGNRVALLVPQTLSEVNGVIEAVLVNEFLRNDGKAIPGITSETFLNAVYSKPNKQVRDLLKKYNLEKISSVLQRPELHHITYICK